MMSFLSLIFFLTFLSSINKALAEAFGPEPSLNWTSCSIYGQIGTECAVLPVIIAYIILVPYIISPIIIPFFNFPYRMIIAYIGIS